MDSGAIHNFIDPATRKRIGLSPQAMNTFEVEEADGEEGKACCRDMRLNIKGYESSADLLVVSLGDT